LIHESTLPYQGGQGGSNLKSIFNLIITSYLILDLDRSPSVPYPSAIGKYVKTSIQ